MCFVAFCYSFNSFHIHFIICIQNGAQIIKIFHIFKGIIINTKYPGGQILKNGVGRAYGTCGDEVQWIQVGAKPEGKMTLGRPRRRWEDNIKIILQEIAWWGKGVGWVHLAQARDAWRTVVNAEMNFRIP